MSRIRKKKTFKQELELYLNSKVQVGDGWDLDDKKYMRTIVKACGKQFEPIHSLPLGGEAFLFFVLNTYIQRKEVLKIPRPDMPPVSLKRFLRSVRTLVKLESPYFPRVLFLSTAPFFVILDWTPGETLRDYVLSRRLYHDEIIEIFREVLKAISLLHQHGVTHRDIRPDNIIINPEGNIKIIDFGLSKTKADKRLTVIKALGNVYYSPPEQLTDAGTVQDATADVYSLAKTFIFMISKQDIEKNKCKADLFETCGFSEKLGDFYKKATKFKPKDRHKNAGEMLEDLEKISPSPNKIELTKEEKENELSFLLEALFFVLGGDLFFAEIFTSHFLTPTELKNLRIMIRTHKVKKILAL